MVVAQGLPGRAAIPAAVRDVSVGRDDVERVVDEVVLQDAVVGRAGGQGGRGVDLRRRRREGSGGRETGTAREKTSRLGFEGGSPGPCQLGPSRNRSDQSLTTEIEQPQPGNPARRFHG